MIEQFDDLTPEEQRRLSRAIVATLSSEPLHTWLGNLSSDQRRVFFVILKSSLLALVQHWRCQPDERGPPR
jgi:hypothetical protein